MNHLLLLLHSSEKTAKLNSLPTKEKQKQNVCETLRRVHTCRFSKMVVENFRDEFYQIWVNVWKGHPLEEEVS